MSVEIIFEFAANLEIIFDSNTSEGSQIHGCKVKKLTFENIISIYPSLKMKEIAENIMTAIPPVKIGVKLD